MKLCKVGLVVMIALSSTFATVISQAFAETPPAVQPRNASEWTRFVGARLQRNSGQFGNVGRKLRIVGEFNMKIGFNVMPDGTVSDVHLVEGSGDQRLDAAALEIPARAEPFPAFTSDMAPTPRAVVAPLVLHLLPEPETP